MENDNQNPAIPKLSEIDQLNLTNLINQILTFSGSESEDIETWLENWDQTIPLTGMKSDQELICLRTKLREPASTWLRQLPARNPDGNVWTIEKIKKEMMEKYKTPNARLHATLKLR